MQQRVLLSLIWLPFAVLPSHLLYYVGKQWVCYHHQHYLQGLEIFEMKEPHSRATIQCDQCGLNIIRHNVKVHTERHHPELLVRERIKRFLHFKEILNEWHTAMYWSNIKLLGFTIEEKNRRCSNFW